MKNDLAKRLEQVEVLSIASKLSRLLNNPFKYINAIFLKNVIYPFTHKEKLVSCNLFTGKKVKVMLPASTDIYLTGGKTHHSEIRLAKFLIQNLQLKDSFWDVGAHYGYYSMLASELVGHEGKVISIEASTTTHGVLKENALQFDNITVMHNAVSDSNQKITFFEMPNLYSEYNTTDISQFSKEKWFARINPNKVEVDALRLDDLMIRQNSIPNMIKIDVEGGEAAVINGALQLLKNDTDFPIVIMEYLEPKRNNIPHIQATKALLELGYSTYIISNDGRLEPIKDIDAFLIEKNLESDNIVFKK